MNPTAATTQQAAGPIGHGVAEQRVELLPDTGFDMQVLYHNRNRDEAAESELGVRYVSMDELLAK